MRVLFLDGENGSVGCRIHGKQQQSPTPSFSLNGTCECASRSLLRMNNLVAVRGWPGERMIGPADYYDNIENAHLHNFTISIDKHCFPTLSKERPSFFREPPAGSLPTFGVIEDFEWISGHFIDEYREKHNNMPSTVQLGYSLFPNPGMLVLPAEKIFLHCVGPGTDLSFFKARLVKNSEPFALVTHKLRWADEFRLVSYIYEQGYAAAQTRNPDGGGLFLELHRFAQFITPLSAACGGYVMLATRLHDKLCLVGVQIPFGWTLIIDDGAIHGDATLQGLFLMGMTSDHHSMQTADTVFLKTKHNYRNVKFVTDMNEEHKFTLSDLPASARPITNHTTHSKVFNPTSRGYWECLWAFTLNKSLRVVEG